MLGLRVRVVTFVNICRNNHVALGLGLELALGLGLELALRLGLELGLRAKG